MQNFLHFCTFKIKMRSCVGMWSLQQKHSEKSAKAAILGFNIHVVCSLPFKKLLISYYLPFGTFEILLLELVMFCLSGFLIMCKIKNGLYSNLFSSSIVVCNLDLYSLYNYSNSNLLDHLKVVSCLWPFCFRPLCWLVDKFLLRIHQHFIFFFALFFPFIKLSGFLWVWAKGTGKRPFRQFKSRGNKAL